MEMLYAKRRNCKGAIMVEFALSFTLVIVLLAVMFQIGYLFFIYNGLQSAVRNGARYASVADFDKDNGVNFEKDVKDVVVYGVTDPGASDPPLVPGLQTSNVFVDQSNKDATNTPITVAITITNYEVPTIWSTFTLSGKPRSTFVYLGQTVE